VTIVLKGTIRISQNDVVLDSGSRQPQKQAKTVTLTDRAKMAIAQIAQSMAQAQQRNEDLRTSELLKLRGLSHHNSMWAVAKDKLADRDASQEQAAIVLQRWYRARRMRKLVGEVLKNRDALKKGRPAHAAEMTSCSIRAPAYLGESCLWSTPPEEWDDESAGSQCTYLYSARCQSRGHVLIITRKCIQHVIDSFSPWLAERFLIFRASVLASSASAYGANATINGAANHAAAINGIAVPMPTGAQDTYPATPVGDPLCVNLESEDSQLPGMPENIRAQRHLFFKPGPDTPYLRNTSTSLRTPSIEPVP